MLAPGVRAETMMTRFYAFMHAGPGMQFAVTDEIPAQTALDPENCGNGWCRIRFGNALGWVEQSVLVSSPPMAQPAAGPAPGRLRRLRPHWLAERRQSQPRLYLPAAGRAQRPAGEAVTVTWFESVRRA